MKKKGILLILILLLGFSLRAQAATYEDYLPGGKNYLDIANTRLRQNVIETITPFRVLPDQSYTISFPGDGTLPYMYIIIGAPGGHVYFEGPVSDLSECNASVKRTACTFTTLQTEEFLYVRMQSTQANEYYNQFGIEDFQLEEGIVETLFEPYVAPVMDIEEPSFVDNGIFIISYLDQTSIDSIINSHITVIDEIDGDITDQIVIEEDNYTPNIQTVGEHTVLLSATDSSGNKAEFQLTIMIKDEIAPIINGPDTIEVSIDNIITIDTIINDNFEMIDEYDGILSYNVVNDDYSINNGLLGTYSVTINTADLSNNITEHTFGVTVYDNVAPSITGLNTLQSFMSTPLSIDDIINSQVVTDNYDVLSVNDITVVSDLYSTNEYISGQYIVTLSVEDVSGNTVTKDITVEVVDDIAPIISGPAIYTDSYTSTITVNDLLELLSISDNVDDLLIEDVVIISDEFSSRLDQVGSYIVTFEVTDSTGNTDNHTIEVILIDDIPPVIYVDEFIVTVSNDVTFDEEDAVRLLLSTNELAAGDYQVETLYDEYTGHEDEEGTYLYHLAFTSEDGEVIEKEFVIRVVADDTVINQMFSLRYIMIYSLSIILIGLTIYKAKK